MKSYRWGTVRVFFVSTAAKLTLAAGLVAFFGWVLDADALKSMIPGAVQMKANTALGLVLSALALMSLPANRNTHYRVGRYALATVVSLLGLLTLCQYLLGWQLHIDELLFRDNANAYNAVPGRMSPFTAWAFLMLGMGLAALRCPRAGWLALVGGLQVALIGGVCLLGYLWNAAELVTDKWLPPVAVNTSVGFLLLGLAVLAAHFPTAPVLQDEPDVSPIEVKVLLGSAGTLLVLVMSAGFTYRAVVSFSRGADLMVATQQSRYDLQKTLGLASLAATHLRAGGAASSEQYASDKRQLEVILYSLSKKSLGGPVRLAKIRQLGELIRERLDWLERGADGRAAADADLHASIEQLGAEIEMADRALLAQQTEALETGRVVMLVAHIVTIGIALAVFVVLIASVRREMARNQLARHEIQALNEELEQRVLERTAELNRIQHRMNTFMSSLAHDLRQPLISVGGFGSLLDNRLVEQGDAQSRGFLQRISGAVSRVDACTDALLQLGHVSRMALWRQTVDVSALAETVVERLRKQHPERQVLVTVQTAMTAGADVKLLELALEHLIDNAWKFTAASLAPCIEVGSSADAAGMTIFWVKDNGVGFDMAYQGKLFIPFQRLHHVDEFAGLGTGLAISEAIIVRHGGRIWAEAQPHEGATFSFTLAPTATPPLVAGRIQPVAATH